FDALLLLARHRGPRPRGRTSPAGVVLVRCPWADPERVAGRAQIPRPRSGLRIRLPRVRRRVPGDRFPALFPAPLRRAADVRAFLPGGEPPRVRHLLRLSRGAAVVRDRFRRWAGAHGHTFRRGGGQPVRPASRDALLRRDVRPGRRRLRRVSFAPRRLSAPRRLGRVPRPGASLGARPRRLLLPAHVPECRVLAAPLRHRRPARRGLRRRHGGDRRWPSGDPPQVASPRRRSTIHSPAGRAVKSASNASRNALLVISPNWRSGGKVENESARKPAALISVAKTIARPE